MVKVILADNQAIFRAGAAKVLAVEDDFRVVAQAQTADQVRMAMARFRASIIICAAGLANPLEEITREAQRAHSRMVVVAEKGERPARYLELGVHGVVFRSVSGPALVECVRKVARGETWVQDAAPADSAEADFVGARVRDRLTPKELRIVALIVQGYKNKEIAARLGTTEQVIKNYLRNVYDKIGVSDRLELALFTIHHRILAEAAAATAASMTQR